MCTPFSSDHSFQFLLPGFAELLDYTVNSPWEIWGKPYNVPKSERPFGEAVTFLSRLLFYWHSLLPPAAAPLLPLGNIHI